MFWKDHPKRWHWMSLLAALVVLFAFTTSAVAAEDELNVINHAIKAKGARWKAEENLVSRLAPEHRRKRLGLILPEMVPQEALQGPQEPLTAAGSVAAAPGGTFDWRNFTSSTAFPGLPQGSYVTGIRDQGNCGSCWAFGTTAALESSALIADKNPNQNLNLAEQVLVSCANAGNCGGGYITTASNYIRNVGLPAETCDPYLAQNATCNPKCADWQTNTRAISAWYYVGNTTAPSVDAIKTALYTYGPMVTTMNVYSDFFYYTGGVYKYTSGSYQGGHAITIVGYDDTNSCFIVKNSWGNWGESGFFRIAYSELNSVVGFGHYTMYYIGEAGPSPPPGPAPPVANFTANPSSGPAPLAVKFTDHSTGSPTGWDWTFGDGAVSQSQNPSHTYANPGPYKVTLKASNPGGATSTSQTVTALAPTPAAPVANFSASPSSGQAPLAVHFTDSSTGNPTAWSWNFGDGIYSQSQNPSHTYKAAGTYNITLTASNAAGSSNSTKTVIATAPPPPNCTFSISPTGRTLTQNGGSGSVRVTSASGCKWTAQSNVTWIHLDSGASGTGNGTVFYSVAPSTSSRNGTITVAGRTFTIYQRRFYWGATANGDKY